MLQVAADGGERGKSICICTNCKLQNRVNVRFLLTNGRKPITSSIQFLHIPRLQREHKHVPGLGSYPGAHTARGSKHSAYTAREHLLSPLAAVRDSQAPLQWFSQMRVNARVVCGACVYQGLPGFLPLLLLYENTHAHTHPTAPWEKGGGAEMRAGRRLLPLC